MRNLRARRAPSLKDIHRAATPSVVAVVTVVTAATAPHGGVSVIESVLPVVVVVARRSERADVSSRAAAGSSGSRAAAGPSDGPSPSASASRARRFHTPCRRRPRRFLRVHGRSLRAAAAFAAEPEEERDRRPDATQNLDEPTQKTTVRHRRGRESIPTRRRDASRYPIGTLGEDEERRSRAESERRERRFRDGLVDALSRPRVPQVETSAG